MRHNHATTVAGVTELATDIAAVLASVELSSRPVALADLLRRHPGLARRTAQRWLARLLADGALESVGDGRGRRYFVPTATTQRRISGALQPEAIPISEDSREIIGYVDQPLEARKPVGYARELLAEYRPNETYYLAQAHRDQLRRIGRPDPHARDDLPAATFGRGILNRLLIDLSWASSHLEGNTYTRLDTRELIEHGNAAEGRARIETQMILNHKAAIEMLLDNADIAGFNRYTVLNLHSALAENLLPNPADEGRTRRHRVEIGKSVYRPLSVPAQIDELLDVLLDKARRIADPFEQSFFVMVHLPYLQPFADVNKRTSRLLANLPLLRANLCPLTFLDVPESTYNKAVLGVYEMTRVELLRDLYMWAYERSTHEYLAVNRDLVEPDPIRLAYRNFIREIVRDVVRSNREDVVDWIDGRIRSVAAKDRSNVRAHVLDDLRRLHEGVLARYGLRVAEYERWRRRGQTP